LSEGAGKLIEFIFNPSITSRAAASLLELRKDGIVEVLLVPRSGCLGMITSRVQQWGKAKETEGCFNVGKVVRMDIDGDKPMSGHVG
jgi:hypothetical protein